jgi:hypothetical protein
MFNFGVGLFLGIFFIAQFSNIFDGSRSGSPRDQGRVGDCVDGVGADDLKSEILGILGPIFNGVAWGQLTEEDLKVAKQICKGEDVKADNINNEKINEFLKIIKSSNGNEISQELRNKIEKKFEAKLTVAGGDKNKVAPQLQQASPQAPVLQQQPPPQAPVPPPQAPVLQQQQQQPGDNDSNFDLDD